MTRIAAASAPASTSEPTQFFARDVLPRLQPVADALRRADQRDLVDQRVGHRGGGLLSLAGEEQVLDLAAAAS